MEAVRKLLLSFFGLCLSVVFSLLVMINGWGLEPQSYWWIIGVGVFGQFISMTIISIANHK